MPRQGRARRVAARQTQLGQRKKRHSREPSDAPSDAPSIFPSSEPPESKHAATSLDESSSPEAPAPQRIADRRPAPSRHAEQRPTVYNYVEAELKRIAIVIGGVLAILITLTFVLS